MKKRHSKWIAILTIATLLAGQTVTAWAEETSDVTEVTEASDIGIEESATDESATKCGEAESDVESEIATETVAEEATETTTEAVSAEESVTEAEVETEVTEESVTETEVETEDAEEETTEAETEVAEEVTTEAETEDVETEVVENIPMLLADEGDTETESATETEQLTPATNLVWSETEIGEVTFEHNNTEGYLALIVYRDGVKQTYCGTSITEKSFDFKKLMDNSGDYTFDVRFYDSSRTAEDVQSNWEDCDCATTSDVFTYTVSERLEVSGITFSENGDASWNAVDGASDYLVMLYDMETLTAGTESPVTAHCAAFNTTINLSSYMEDGKEYAIGVKAYSEDLSKYGHTKVTTLYSYDGEVETESESDSATGGEVAGEVLPPTYVKWSDTKPGNIYYDNPNDEPVLIAEQIIFEDEKPSHPFGFYVAEAGEGGGMSYGDAGMIKESGDYTVVVKVFPADMSVEEMLDVFADWEIYTTSSVYSYTYPGVTLPTVTSVQYNSTGIVTWDAVDNEYVDYYTFQLWDVTGGNQYYTASRAIEAGEECAIDCLEYITEGKDYAVTIDVLSNNIEEIYHSESDLIPLVINDEGISEEVNNTLTGVTGNLTDNSSADEVTTAVADVKSTFANTQEKRELQLAMQTNSDTRAEIERLEELYEEAMNVNTVTNVAGETGIDASKVSILGASLNATQAGKVSFNMSLETDEKMAELLGDDSLAKSICFSLDLTGAGVTPGNLDIPVTITMPAPNDINTHWLRAYHYGSDGTVEDVAIRQNADGTISFTVTHFSEFIFYEEEVTTSTSTSSDSNSSSTSVKKVKPWTPTTEDEKARYSVFGREKLNYIVGTEGGYKAELVNAMQGRLFFDAVDAAKGDYTVARTYNVEIDGKLVYETTAPAMFVLDIPTEYQAAGRDYKMVCVSKGGEVIILDDLDTAAETITFLTNKYYAFALIYKDAAITE